MKKTEHDADLPSKHSLNALARKDPKGNLVQLLINANPDKLMKVQNLLLDEDE